MRRSPFVVVLASALLVASCSGGDEVTETDPGRLVVWNDGAIGVLEGEQIGELDATGAVSQVTASVGGALVWTRVGTDPPSVAAVLDDDGTAIDTPTVPFFYQWNPPGNRVAFLGNAPSGGGLVFGLIDVQTEELSTIESPPPFFFDWSPDGTRLITHVGGTLLRVIDAETGDAQDLDEPSGAFPAPIWTDRGVVVATAVAPTVSTPILPVSYQSGVSDIVLLDPDTGSRAVLAEVEAPVRLFATDGGLALAIGAAGAQRIDVIGWDGEPRATLGGGTIDLVQWSPDGATLLWTERTADGALTPMTWSDGTTEEYEAFRPSAVFASAYLPFWDQYDRTISLWSADSMGFALPTSNGVTVYSGDGTTTYPGWEMGIWSGPADG